MNFTPSTSGMIGLMGGMFDPVHNGHINVALSAMRLLTLDELRLLPCGVPVHRPGSFADGKDRLAMLELAIAGLDGINVDARELASSQPSYAIHSILAVKDEKPGCGIVLVMGMDTFNSLPTWHRWHELIDMAHLLVIERPGCEPVSSGELAEQYRARKADSPDMLRDSAGGRILTCRFAMLDISSSGIRERIRAHRPVDELLPKQVKRYIDSKGLYGRSD